MLNRELPSEIYINILRELDPIDILNYIGVSKSFRDVFTKIIKILPPEKKSMILSESSKYNNTKLLQSLIDIGCTLQSEKLSESAASVGALNVIQWLYENRYSTKYMIEIIKWDKRYNYDNLKVISETAALHGHIIILKWLMSIKYTIEESVTISAIRGQQQEIIEWLYDNKLLNLSFNTYDHVVCSGNTKFFVWATQKGINIDMNVLHVCDLTSNICKWAIFKENLEMMKCLNTYVTKWDESTCALAAYYGKIIILDFLQDNNCPIDFNHCYISTNKRKYPDVITWLNKHSNTVTT